MFICLLNNNTNNTHCQKFLKKLRYLKSKVIKTKQNQSLFDRKEFVKKSVVRRAQVLKASYVQKKKNSLD